MWLFGTGEVDVGTSQGELWDKTRSCFGILEDDISIFKKVIIWKILRWLQHLLQDEKWPNYQDMAGRYLMPHKYHLALHFWCPHTRNANDRTRNTNLPERGLTCTLYLRGHLPVIYKIFLNPIDRTTDSDPMTTMIVFNSNKKYFEHSSWTQPCTWGWSLPWWVHLAMAKQKAHQDQY
jgi:hypothetical protein